MIEASTVILPLLILTTDIVVSQTSHLITIYERSDDSFSLSNCYHISEKEEMVATGSAMIILQSNPAILYA